MNRYLCLLILALLVRPVLADEGLWPFDNPPLTEVRKKYGVSLSQDWMSRLRNSTAELNSGGSGFFISKDGLLLTTQHGLAAHLNEAMITDGFLSKTPDGEMRLENLALKAGDRIYEDVRLVFCPEGALAYFGGQVDNFEFPRYCLDIALLRAYEDGRPARIDAFLELAEAGPQEGAPVFTAGYPRTSERTSTVAHLEFLRDKRYPMSLDYLRRLELILLDHSEKGRQEAQEAAPALQSVHHARKLYSGILANLEDPDLMEQKRRQEERLRREFEKPESSPWKIIEDRAAHYESLYDRYYLLAAGKAFNSLLFEQARARLRSQPVEETEIAPQLEKLKLAESLGLMVDWLGADDPLTRKVLAGHSPWERAAELVDDPAALEALLKDIEPLAQEIEQRFQDEVMKPVNTAYQQLKELTGPVGYPDADGGLRFGYGRARGYREGGLQIAYRTTLGDLFKRSERAENQAPWHLPTRWQKGLGLPMETGLNFVADLDVQDGSGGGPVVDAQGRVVGLVFDANRWGMGSDFFFDSDSARAVCVDIGAVKVSLSRIYGLNI